MRKSGRVQSCDYVLVRPLELTVFMPVASQRCSLQVCRSASQQKLQPLPAAPINLTLSTHALPSSLWPLMVAGPAAFPFPLLPRAQAGGTDVLLHQCSNPVCAPPKSFPYPQEGCGIYSTGERGEEGKPWVFKVLYLLGTLVCICGGAGSISLPQQSWG